MSASKLLARAGAFALGLVTLPRDMFTAWARLLEIEAQLVEALEEATAQRRRADALSSTLETERQRADGLDRFAREALAGDAASDPFVDDSIAEHPCIRITRATAHAHYHAERIAKAEASEAMLCEIECPVCNKVDEPCDVVAFAEMAVGGVEPEPPTVRPTGDDNILQRYHRERLDAADARNTGICETECPVCNAIDVPCCFVSASMGVRCG